MIDLIDIATARDDAYTRPLDTLNPARPRLFASDAMWPYFERLRREDPVHYTAESALGPYWSVTKYNDIVAIDTDHKAFSSRSGIALAESDLDMGPFPMFIAMDPPRHDEQRKVVSPAVAPPNLARLAPLIRTRAGAILDGLPINEKFNWVDKVSMELTAMTLATLFDVPQEDRRRLTRWSDVLTSIPGYGVVDSLEQKRTEVREFFEYFTKLWDKRRSGDPGSDLISMLAHGADTCDMPTNEYLGNIMLLTVGGNDTTRNTISGSVYALNKFPAEYEKLRADAALLQSMVPEVIRWQTPLAHMRRTATSDVEFRGKTIRKGDKVVMWYVSGNRDEDVVDRPDDLVIDRPRPRQHLSFGFGIHRCVGNRLAELQLTIIWEEILKRFPTIEVVSEPKRTFSNFVKGYESMDVIIPRRF